MPIPTPGKAGGTCKAMVCPLVSSLQDEGPQRAAAAREETGDTGAEQCGQGVPMP